MAGPKLNTVIRTQGNNEALKSGAVMPRANSGLSSASMRLVYGPGGAVV